MPVQLEAVQRELVAIRTTLVGLEGEERGGMAGDIAGLREDMARWDAKLDKALRVAERASWWARISLAAWPVLPALALGLWKLLKEKPG